ncbi:hypothetical protein [Candidatus Poriferisodalis sp.]|uniref:hypothetical protein n=1 Tax=Candidatus Poriferisodalis sp. TaxID=3101277 RepID=UPI003B59B3D0
MDDETLEQQLQEYEIGVEEVVGAFTEAEIPYFAAVNAVAIPYPLTVTTSHTGRMPHAHMG